MTVNWNGAQVEQMIRDAAFRGIVKGTNLVLSTAVQSILTGSKSGRVYRRGGITHQASAPGEPPASDTGRLVQSGKTEFDKGNVEGRVRFSTRYAAALEFGTIKIEPRPYARPALAKHRKDIESSVAAEINAVLK